MLSRVVLSAAAAAGPSLKSAALLGPGVLQATRIFHTGQPSLAPVPPLPEYGGKVRHGLIPEEFFQFLYPKTGVTGPYMLGTGLILYFLSKEIYVVTPETISAISTIGLLVFMVKKYGASVGEFADKLNEQKIAQLEEAKQASMKGIQDAAEGAGAHDKLGGEARGAEHLRTAGEGDDLQVHLGSEAACKEGPGAADHVNDPPRPGRLETLTERKWGCGRSFPCRLLLESSSLA
ncbi:ATP synthase peripheral stalk-membrane subunit b [Phyllostomus discolor]|uniref:ATP synthase subunit b n=1 Tax=Phyllostomus discolor TaxID=89673 RepID=A0A833YD50_9CHIR|nr:ATP synthase peripheral stalk-membrane subunit b [Phyllostomus discolor]